MIYPLNEDQIESLKLMEHFILDPSKKMMVLSGMAGTGKSVVLGEFMKNSLPTLLKTLKAIDKDFHEPSVYLTSTTNEAARVLEGYVGLEVPTIYSLARMYPTKGGKLFRPISSSPGDCGNPNPKVMNVVIVDEFSYLSDQAFEMLISAFTSNTKFIFVGDKNQLALSNNGESYVIERIQEYKDLNSDSYDFLELTKIERSTDQDLTDLVVQLHNDLETGTLSDIQFNGSSIVHISKEEFDDYVDTNQFNVYGHNIESGGNDERILAYDNITLNKYGERLRRARKLTPLLTRGEIVINNKFITLPKGMTEKRHISLKTRQEFEVTSASTNTSRISLDILLDESITIIEDIMGEKINLDFTIQNLKIRDRNNPDAPAISINYLPNRKPLESLLAKIDAKTKDLLKSVANSDYSKPNLLNNVHKTLSNLFPNLRPAEVNTIHSAQGSSYDNVYIMLSSLDKVRNLDPTLIIKLLYVATSRAKKRVVFVGNISQRVIQAVTK